MEQLTEVMKTELIIVEANSALERSLKLRNRDINGLQDIFVVVLGDFPLSWLPFENVCFDESLRPRLKQVLITLGTRINLSLNHLSLSMIILLIN